MELIAELERMSVFGRLGKPEEIAAVVALLVGEGGVVGHRPEHPGQPGHCVSDLEVSPEDASAGQDEPVTVVVSRLVKRGKEDAFERWIRGIGNEALRFPGHQGINVIRPTDPARPEYVVIFRFDRYSNLRRWVDSDERQIWLERVDPLVVGTMKVKELSGMEGWVSLPGAALVSPPRYKIAMATWFAIFPISLALSAWVVPRMMSVTLVPRTLAISACLVLLMTYAVMPAVTLLLRSWLFALNVTGSDAHTQGHGPVPRTR